MEKRVSKLYIAGCILSFMFMAAGIIEHVVTGQELVPYKDFDLRLVVFGCFETGAVAKLYMAVIIIIITPVINIFLLMAEFVIKKEYRYFFVLLAISVLFILTAFLKG